MCDTIKDFTIINHLIWIKNKKYYMLGSTKEEYMRPEGVKNYKVVGSSGKPDGLGPKMVLATRDWESEVFKDSSWVFFWAEISLGVS